MWTLLVGLALAKRPSEAPPPMPPRVEVPAEATPTAGSLWSDRTGLALAGEGGGRRIGDLVTVRIVESTTTTLDATTRTDRKSKTEAGIDALLGAETTIPAARPSMNGKIAIAGSSTGSFAGNGKTTRGSTAAATLTCEVIEVLPDGNLHIWGYKAVRVNRETQYVVLDGVVRPRDIGLDNSVSSERLARANIEITGSGVVADDQGPGIGARAVARLWPF